MTARRTPRHRAPPGGGYTWTALDGAERAVRSRKPVPRRRPRRPRKRGTPLKVYIGVTIVCFLVASALCFVTGQGPKMLQQAIRRYVQETISEEGEKLKQELRQDLSDTDLDALKKRYSKHVE